MTEAELVEVAQIAYDPETAVAFDLLRARQQPVELDWAGAGPSFLSEARECVRLPGGAAETVEMRRARAGSCTTIICGGCCSRRACSCVSGLLVLPGGPGRQGAVTG